MRSLGERGKTHGSDHEVEPDVGNSRGDDSHNGEPYDGEDGSRDTDKDGLKLSESETGRAKEVSFSFDLTCALFFQRAAYLWMTTDPKVVIPPLGIEATKTLKKENPGREAKKKGGSVKLYNRSQERLDVQVTGSQRASLA